MDELTVEQKKALFQHLCKTLAENRTAFIISCGFEDNTICVVDDIANRKVLSVLLFKIVEHYPDEFIDVLVMLLDKMATKKEDES